MKVLTTLDLAKNQIINLRIENQASAPQNPVEGQIYYDTTDHTVKQYNGTAWVEMGSSYTLPTASASTLGGIKVGDNLAIDANGVLTSKNVEVVEVTNDNKSTLTKTYIENTYLNKGIMPVLKCTLDNDAVVLLSYMGVAQTGNILTFGAIAGPSALIVQASSLGLSSVGVFSLQEALEFNTAYDATTNKAATMTDVNNAVAAIGTVMDLKGTKATYAEIEAIVNPEAGDVWICTADNSEYVYVDGDPTGHWEKFGPTIDLSGYLQIANLASDLTGESTTTAPTQKAVHDALALKANAADVGSVVAVTITSGTTGTASVPTGKDFVGYYAYTETSGTREQVFLDAQVANGTVTFTASTSGTYYIKAYFK